MQPDGSTHFRVWAPAAGKITLALERGATLTDVALEPEASGYYSADVPGVTNGNRYWYRLDGELLPDPASRFQPDGPFASSAVVDPGLYQWTSASPRLQREGQVIYEMHIGTFTPEGTWRAATAHLERLARTGITVLEVMPVSEFPGRFGWGYDGVFPYAPTRLYGTPDDFRAFVDAAHQYGLAVILDVVYNHLGPDGCVFRKYSPAYFAKTATEWGDSLNFDGDSCVPVREYFVENAAHWIAEFRLDGLRLDATQSIADASREHIVGVIADRVRQAAGGRTVLVVAENEPQSVRLVRPRKDGGLGVDMLWNDDYHHSAVVAMTGRREAYYSDHRGTPQEFVSAAKRGFLFQGQRYAWQRQPRGSRTDGLPPAAFVNFIENHDQIANSGDGSRMHRRTTAGRYRAMTALTLLLPGTPMLFQGQEFGSSKPFLYFADHRPELAASVQAGRLEFVSQFPSLASPAIQERMAPPHDPGTFERCKLDWRELETHGAQTRLHQDLLALRRSEPAFRAQAKGAVDGAVVAAEAFVLRFAADEKAGERLLIVNLGQDLREPSFCEPLVAPPDGCRWQCQWSSEHPDYGGFGVPALDEREWRIPGHSAMVLRPVPVATEQTHDGDATHGR